MGQQVFICAHIFCRLNNISILDKQQLLQTLLRMNFGSRKQKKEREIMEQHVGYAEGSVKEYLNIKRSSKDRCCTVVFCLYMLVLIMLAGLGFFYGNFGLIGTFVVEEGSKCQNFLKHKSTNNTYSCDGMNCGIQSPYLYLQKICVDSNFTVASNSLAMQIAAYNINQTLPFMLYVNVGILVGTLLFFILIICYRKLVYFYIFLSFVLLLGFAFYLLKSINDRVTVYNNMYSSDSYFKSSLLISQEQSLQPLAFILLALYLILFPVILFAPSSIRLAIKVLQNMYKYFASNYTMVLFSVCLSLLNYGLLFLVTFLLLNFLTAGTKTFSSSSFFYFYETIHLSHPALLVVFFIGVYWLLATLCSWQQFAMASSVIQWFFEDGGKMKPVKKSAKRAWYNLGSAAIDALLFPFQWIALLLYSIGKMDSEVRQKYQNEHPEDCICFNNMLYSIRKLVTKFYIKVNRGAPVAGALTNNNYIESCELAAVNFSQKNHRFFNVGGSLSLFLNLFSVLIFLTINYLALYYHFYDGFFPAKISSLGLQVILAIMLGLCVGQSLSNIFGTTADTILFCFLMEKRGGVQVSTHQIKKVLQQFYAEEEEITEVLQMCQIESDTE